MSTHVTELFAKASILSEEERATLAGLLIESLESEVDSDVEEAWRVEIERRVAELDSGTAQTSIGTFRQKIVSKVDHV